MRRLISPILVLALLACAPSSEQAQRTVEAAARGTAGVYAPSEIARARQELAAAEQAQDRASRRNHLRAAMKLAGDAMRTADAQRMRVSSEATQVRQRAVEQRKDVLQMQDRLDEQAAPQRSVSAPDAVRQWSPDALEDAIRMGSPLAILDVGDERRCERAHVLGAQCITPAAVALHQIPSDREVIIMGDGDHAVDQRVDAALIAMQRRDWKNLGVLRGGMRAWRQDARPWTGTDRAAPDGLRAVRLSELHGVLSGTDENAWRLVDVRPPALFAAGHVAGARNVPAEHLEAHLTALPRGARVLVYSADDGSSLAAAQRAARVEGRAVAYLIGGVRGAVMAGVPLEQGNVDVLVATGGAQ